jgi:LCP family protein required for cell wall assembly
MQRTPKRSSKRRLPIWIWFALPLLAGLLIGWFALGWGIWPAVPKDALPSDLRTAEREAYLTMVAESFTADGNRALARQKVESWSSDALAADIGRLEARQAGVDALQAGDLRALAAALGLRPIVAATAAPAEPVDLTRTENILVLGTDNRPELEAWRTDSIMVVVIDPKIGQVGIVSIPRDLYVDVPGYDKGKERLNAVAYIGEKLDYPGGGPALVRQVVEDQLGIPTQHYVIIHQDGLIKLVDALGGVTVNLDCPLYEATPDDKSPTGIKTFTLPAGPVQLDGTTAKKFATYRYVQTDFGRTQRQQQLIWAIRNRVLEANLLPKIPVLWSALSDTFTTDLDLPAVLKLARLASRLQARDIHGMQLGDMIEEYTTSEGWMVLVLKDKALVREKLTGIFSSKPLSQTGKGATSTGECPPSPFEDQGAGTSQ